ncbi:MarR family winged helix-turn-helix transcriptional regulator [Huintestinicola sp.]|uniref:MarR family winged helix-turn-helix transcriptional regulator n=1 Tax=Huintestinicola sp. TaxID=2981661 RepID=UPI003D7EBF89
MVQRPIEVVLKGGEFRKYSDSKFALLRKHYGMKRAEFEVIYYLSICKDADSLVNITEFLNANKGHISSTVYGLTGKGYITSVQDKNDRRYLHFSLTDKGKEVAADIESIWNNIRNELFCGLTEEEIAEYKKTSYKICKNIEHFMT